MLDRTLHPVAGDNDFLRFKVVLDKVAYDSIAELQARWIDRLAGVPGAHSDRLRARGRQRRKRPTCKIRR